MATLQSACILCSRNCGLLVDVEDGRFKRVRGDETAPHSKGYVCQKAVRLEHYQFHEDRLRQPLRRQTDGEFVAVSWDEALSDIAERLMRIRDEHGGDAFAFVGGGGQGNHLGGFYSRQMLAAMRSRYMYNAFGQEKTGDFWLNGRMFGHQTCHTTEDVEHADFVLIIGANPFQSHGIPNARTTLLEIKKNPAKTMVVVDPRRTETAGMADIHLQLKPGTDAYLISALLAIILREGLQDKQFLAEHCRGFAEVEEALLEIDVAEYARRADVPLVDLERVARGFATAHSACVRIDLGIQHTLHTTLNGYLEKLLYLLTGNFGKPGGNNLHSFLLPIIGHTDERKKIPGKELKRTAHHQMHPIAGIYPPNILADEIEHAGENRLRALIIDSANPAVTYADSAAIERALKKLELLVVVDVAMTETARMAHYILPAASQFEKWEASGFNLEFPKNFFQLRQPLVPPIAESLPEAEIYTRLLEKMGLIPGSFPLLEGIARLEPSATAHAVYMSALTLFLARHKSWRNFAASIMYRTLGKSLPDAAAAAPILPLAIHYSRQHKAAVQRAGHRGKGLLLGTALFRAILQKRSGVVLSQHEFRDTWSLIKTPDKRVHLAVPEMLEELRALPSEVLPGANFPFILMAGERRSYNANQIYRNPAWRKGDPHGAMRMHPDDAEALGLEEGTKALCESVQDRIEVVVTIDDSVRRGVVTLPHGYGMRYKGSAAIGPQLNRLTSSQNCDAFSRTPYHKYVPVHIRRAAHRDQY